MAANTVRTQHHQLGIDYAKELDARDPLGGFRERFYVRPDRIYLDGN